MDSGLALAQRDADHDGYTGLDGDCDDAVPTTNPGTEERCGDGVDDNCDGQVDEGCAGARDTGTAYLASTGEWRYDQATGDLRVTEGFSAMILATGAVACVIYGDYASTQASNEPCPGCDYAFDAVVVGGGTAGDLCASFIPGSPFDVSAHTYEDFWIGNGSVRGWGWQDSYAYVATDGVEFQLTSAIFARYAYGGGAARWRLFHYNVPAASLYPVSGDVHGASWRHYAGGSPEHYYYFYY